MKPVKQKVVLITGAARRIGAAIAKYLHAEKMNIIVHYHQSKKEAEALVSELNSTRENSASAVQADLRDVSAIESMAAEAISIWGHVDVLINNASGFYRTQFGESTPEQWDDLMNANLKGPYFLSQSLKDTLQNQKGCIINITDIHSQHAKDEYGIYCISKAGLKMLTQSLAKECAPAVRVNAISPGSIIWPEGENEDEKAQLINRAALKCTGNPDDIAKAAKFLIQDADFITGETIHCDGGCGL